MIDVFRYRVVNDVSYPEYKQAFDVHPYFWHNDKYSRLLYHGYLLNNLLNKRIN